MIASAWFRRLVRNRFAISPTRIPFALQASIYSIVNSMLRLVQECAFGRRIAESEIARPPIFINGQWRTGTTHLHELLALDESLVAPNRRSRPKSLSNIAGVQSRVNRRWRWYMERHHYSPSIEQAPPISGTWQ